MIIRIYSKHLSTFEDTEHFWFKRRFFCISGQQKSFYILSSSVHLLFYRVVQTVSTEIGSDEESDVVSVRNFEAKYGRDHLFEVETDVMKQRLTVNLRMNTRCQME
ncbi:Protein CELLULOSE SYNTHASE INTERACTIVE [Trichinella pseudospiralis]